LGDEAGEVVCEEGDWGGVSWGEGGGEVGELGELGARGRVGGAGAEGEY